MHDLSYPFSACVIRVHHAAVTAAPWRMLACLQYARWPTWQLGRYTKAALGITVRSLQHRQQVAIECTQTGSRLPSMC